ncbi:MAG TPA: hypothetical protein VHX86_05285 [Tepidisphaeraceae bacterium]|nr:hypothetical protein [Tepidisphaeraceae bacterium]
MIQFDPDGNTVNPLTGAKYSKRQTEKQFTDILDNIQTYLANKSHPTVLIYVHGGLNSPDDAVAVAQAHLTEISQEDKSCYAIFAIWNSGLGSTYAEHLFDVRQGRKDSETETWGKFDFPVYLFSDFLVAIARAPTVWLQQGATDMDSVEAGLASIASYHRTTTALQSQQSSTAATRSAGQLPDHAEVWLERKHQVNTAAFYLQLNRLYYQDSQRPSGQPRKQIAISIGPDESKPVDWFSRAAVYAAFLPAKQLNAPLVDALGTPAWRDMSRRAQTIVDGSSDFRVTEKTTQSEITDYVQRGTNGGLDLFMSELASRSQPAKGAAAPPWQITLIAHSAGSIVLNEVLRRQIQREVQPGEIAPLPVRNIVYMAPACTIRDFTESVIPFMELKNHSDSQFFDLTLHPSAETLEAEFYELIPRGSLLCWIDDFLGSPQTPLDRTLGRWDNILQVPYVFPQSLRGRVAIKAFALQRPGAKTSSPPIWEPQIHGDFSQSPFWDSRFWQPDPPLSPDNPRIKVAKMENARMKEEAPRAVNNPAAN